MYSRSGDVIQDLVNFKQQVTLQYRAIRWVAVFLVILSVSMAFSALFPTHVRADVFDGEPIEVHDLHFGEVLFHFYQNHHFTAIVKLLAAKELGLIPNHSEEVDALLAGFYLNYGLHQEAEQELRKMADKGVPIDIRNRAWIKLGQARYQKGLYADAIRALEEIERPIPADIEDEIQLQMGNLLIATRQYGEAVKLLTNYPGGSDNNIFAKFNLGIALFKDKKQILGAEHLDQVGTMGGSNPEIKAVKDKANIILGYALLMNDDAAKSMSYFQRVRIEGPFSNKALLGLGWANVMQGNYEEALTPWNILVARPPLDSSVYESMLAVPFALEKLESVPKSLDAYQYAIDTFTDEIENLDATINIIHDGGLWQSILDNVKFNTSGEDTDLSFIPGSIKKHYVSAIISTHAFHETVRNLQDLRFLRENLQHWADSMPAYDDMLALRKHAFKKRLPELLPEEGIYKLAALKDEADLMAEEMRRIESQNDLGALATEQEQALIQKLGNLRDFLLIKKQQLAKDKVEDYEAKYRLYAGLLEWDIGSTIMPRRWKIKRELRELNKAITEASRQAKNLQRAKGIAPRGFEGYDRQISSYKKKIVRLQKRVESTYSSQRQTMERLIVGELKFLKHQIGGYLDQARFAMARLQDSSSR
ncbi:MAG: tetratricopeptide repeat protein [Thiohalomonadales bacterium]